MRRKEDEESVKFTSTKDPECVKHHSRVSLGGGVNIKRTKRSVIKVKLLRAREGRLIRTRGDGNWF